MAISITGTGTIARMASTWRQNNKALSHTIQQVTTGKRILKAADDASGVAISSSLEAKTRSLSRASQNATDMLAMIDTALGGTNELIDLLTELRELAVQGASEALSDDDTQIILFDSRV